MKWPWTKPKPVPPKRAEIMRHQIVLRLFLKNETSLGCYQVAGLTLERAREAMAFLAYTDLAPGSEEEKP